MPRTSKIFFLAILIVLAAFFLMPTQSTRAAPLVGVPVTVTQPDGQSLQLFASGDEYYNWLHDKNGYTVLRDPATGWYVYADLVNGELVPTKLVAGHSNPTKAGLLPGLNISAQAMGDLRAAQRALTLQEAPGVSPAPSIGTLTNLVVFIRFTGEADFTNNLSTYTGMFNDSTPGANSLRNYFLDVSYSSLTVTSNFYPTPAGSTVLSYQDSHPRSYFQPYDAATNPGGYLSGQRTEREQTLLRDAIESIKALGQFPAGSVIDGDNDGEVDSMTFVIKGSGNGWAELLWPHQWSLFYYDVNINGKMVGSYAFQLDDWMGNSVLAHEMFHVLGSPDLYHYNFDGFHPVGTWDVMESNTNPPQHMGCYMKFKYGDWIETIPQITQPGTYTLYPLTSATNNCYKIASPNSPSEFFILEYRLKTTSYFETGIPGSGLLVYRINPAVTGNSNGPPDEVYIFRPGGTPTQDGTYQSANFSSTVGRTQINSATNPATFLSGGGYGGLSLCNIGAADATISFTYGMCGALQVSPASHDFGSVNIGATSSAQAFTLTNNGSGSVTVGTLSVSSPYNLASNTCNGTTLAPAASCTFSITFSPLSAGSLPGLVTIPSNDPSSPNLVGLTGTGSGVFANVSPTSWDFGDQSVSFSSGVKSFTLTSSGNGSLVLGTLGVSGDFSLASNTCNGQTLVPAATCTFGVVFTPTALGARSGSVTIPSNAFGSPTTVALNGNGTTAAYCSSSGDPGYEYISRVQLGSGDQPSGGDAYHDYTATSFTLLARGTSNLLQVTGKTNASYMEYVKAWVDFNHDFDFGDPGEEINLGASVFSGTHVFNGDLGVPAGALLGPTRMRVILRYNAAPSACLTGYYGETEDYTVTIVESLEPDVQVTPAVWDFGNQAVGTTSAAKTFTLTNSGSGNLLTGTLTASGDFALTGNTCNGQTILPAGTCTFGVTFAPASEGIKNGSISIPSNAAGSPHAVPLSGMGIQPPSAFNKTSPANGSSGVSTSPTLSWETSTHAQAYEYCIDNTNDAACNTTWILVNENTSVPLSGLNSATTYYWQVRATNPDGVTYANGDNWWSFTTQVVPPGAFNKSTPVNGATEQPTSLSLTWEASSGATSYEYCLDTTNDGACSGWTDNGLTTSKALSGLSEETTYYWNVRANNAGGTTYANGSSTATWSFTTSITPPSGFGKLTPLNGSIDHPTNLTLTWAASTGAASYEYCLDRSNNAACDTTWVANGSSTSAILSGLAPGTGYSWQVRAINGGGTTSADGDTWWSFTTAPTFSDVPISHWAWSWIERLYASGITAGCGTSPLIYCPEQSVTRAQMAVFLERGLNGPSYTPPPGTGTLFADVTFSHWAVNWIEKLYADGITAGCMTTPLMYCPENGVKRSEMAVFLLRAKYGKDYVPPEPAGIFSDVPTTHWAAAWIEKLAVEGITAGCGGGLYCPEQMVTRAQMAVFLVRTFELP